MSLVLAATPPNDPQQDRLLNASNEGSIMGLIGARWVPFTSKTRPISRDIDESVTSELLSPCSHPPAGALEAPR